MGPLERRRDHDGTWRTSAVSVLCKIADLLGTSLLHLGNLGKGLYPLLARLGCSSESSGSGCLGWRRLGSVLTAAHVKAPLRR